MDLAPEKFDRQFWQDLVGLVSKLCAIAIVVVGGAGGAESLATSSLNAAEQEEAKGNVLIGYGEHVTEDLKRQAACDSALESFRRHRDDEADFEHMWEMCHSHEEGP